MKNELYFKVDEKADWTDGEQGALRSMKRLLVKEFKAYDLYRTEDAYKALDKAMNTRTVKTFRKALRTISDIELKRRFEELGPDEYHKSLYEEEV